MAKKTKGLNNAPPNKRVQPTASLAAAHAPFVRQKGFPCYHTMKKQISRISILQSSKIMTALYVLMGFVYTLIGIPMVIFGNAQLKIMGIIYCFGPILFGILGFVCFVLFAAIYNGLAKWLGGVEVEVTSVP